MGRLPDFIIVGAMKCATSTLNEQLAAQSGIFMSTPKEPCFFSNDEVYARGLHWYASLFDGAADSDLCGESSTHYTKLPTYPHTIHRMQRHVPDAKLIYIMRHPIDRLVSHYVHDWTECKVNVPIDKAIDYHPELIAYSRYAMQLEPFLEAFGSERILLVFFERLVADSQAELGRICRFLGYTSSPIWPHRIASRNVSRQRLRKNRLRDAIVWNRASTVIRQRFIPQSWRDWAKELWQMKDRPKLSLAVRARVRDIFDRDLATLGTWLGLSLSCETFAVTARRATPTWERSGPVQHL